MTGILQFCFSLYEVVHKHVFAVPYGICELAYPFSENDEACVAAEEQVKFDVAVAEDEEVDVRMALEVVLCIEHETFLVFSLVWFFTVVLRMAVANETCVVVESAFCQDASFFIGLWCAALALGA